MSCSREISKIDHDVTGRSRATDQDVLCCGRIDRLWVIADVSADEARLAVVAYTNPA
jgi:hypothetical protein